MHQNAFYPKHYFVQKFPFRARKLLMKIVKDFNNVMFLESAVVVSLDISNDGLCNSLSYIKDGDVSKVTADLFIICAGALESPRILLQSKNTKFGLSDKIGQGLVDHPHGIIGKITLPEKIFYKSHGGTSSSLLSPHRTGFIFKNKFRRREHLNHSIFF